jgi:hypothetical protein
MKSCIKISFILLSFLFIQSVHVNAVFALSTNLYRSDSVQPLSKNFLYNDNLPAGKISLPGKDMIKKADNEMHRNMKNDLIGLQFSNKINPVISASDLEISNDFYLSNQIPFSYSSVFGDEMMTNLFYAEQINFSFDKLVLTADYQINKMFYLSK